MLTPAAAPTYLDRVLAYLAPQWAAPPAGARGPALRGHAGRPGARAVDRRPALDAHRRPADRAGARPLGAARHASAAGCDAAVAALGLLVPPRRVPRSARMTPTALVGETLVRPAQWATPRDAWLAWPARIGPELAADLGLDATRVMIALEPYVRRQLQELADMRLDVDRPRSAGGTPR